MKKATFILIILVLFSCKQTENDTKIKTLQKRIEILETKLSNTYKPGFGEMMTSIQSHHAKLWFAGQAKNWELANFEIKELNEILEDISKYQKDRSETQYLSIIYPSIKAMSEVIKNKDFKQFNINYEQITNSCNKCHQTTNFGYNLVKTPTTSSFSNQEFKINY